MRNILTASTLTYFSVGMTMWRGFFFIFFISTPITIYILYFFIYL
jgi:hypothetical protein